jgi:hypothetical protein
MNYRKVWEEANGPIPRDLNGISYEIHHIDGNKHNNDISNLLCVTVQEHYNIHLKQKDWMACHMISERLNISKEERLMLNSKISKSKKGISTGPRSQESIEKQMRSRKENGFSQTEESRLKISLGNQGKTMSEEARSKISKSKKGKPWTEARKKAQVDRQLAGKVSKLKGVPKNKKRKYENIP